MSFLQVCDLTVNDHTDDGVVRAVDGTSFDLAAGERLGLVGKSGSGKTTIALALIQMLRPPGRADAGSAVVGGIDLLRLSPSEDAPASAAHRQRYPARGDEFVEPGAAHSRTDDKRADRS